ncbi:DUF805 domain-containing protein [Planktotalea sp.]|uniref:DUF805 domain-containing protein n=1 Tax=Planktotalea sp. TaxID=2029877 RepID=UPI00344B1846
MSSLQSIATSLRKSFTFSGRATRKEFWTFFVFHFVALIIVFWAIVLNATGSDTVVALTLLCAFMVLIMPFVSVGWRRYHDIGRAGWPSILPYLLWTCGILFSFIEREFFSSGQLGGIVSAMMAYSSFMVAGIAVLVPLFRPSQPSSNQYGPNPHKVSL